MGEAAEDRGALALLADEWLTAKQIAERLNVSRTHAHALALRIEHVRIGRAIRVRASVLAAYLAKGGDPEDGESEESGRWSTRTDAKTADSSGARATTRTAKGGTGARSRRHKEQQRKLREL